MVGNQEEREYSAGGGVREWWTGWRRASWGAIFAGTFVAVALFLVLQVLGAGIGLKAINLTHRGAANAEALGIGAMVWSYVMGLISLFIGGWTAGRLGWRPSKIDRILHGLTVWSFFYLVMFLLAATALGALTGGSLPLLGSSISAAGQAASTPPGQQAANISGWTFIGLAIAMLVGAIVAMLGSLAVPAPAVYVPPRAREREMAGTAGGRDYSSKR
jgi:hypothetical protein